MEQDRSQRLEREKRGAEKKKRFSGGSGSGDDKSPAFMLIAPPKLSPVCSL